MRTWSWRRERSAPIHSNNDGPFGSHHRLLNVTPALSEMTISVPLATSRGRSQHLVLHPHLVPLQHPGRRHQVSTWCCPQRHRLSQRHWGTMQTRRTRCWSSIQAQVRTTWPQSQQRQSLLRRRTRGANAIGSFEDLRVQDAPKQWRNHWCPQTGLRGCTSGRLGPQQIGCHSPRCKHACHDQSSVDHPRVCVAFINGIGEIRASRRNRRRRVVARGWSTLCDRPVVQACNIVRR